MVNNAGFGLVGSAASLDRAEQLAMIDLNVRMLTDLSLDFIDSLARHRGGILNVGSMAGFLPGPGMAIYYASKAYVLLVQRSAAQRAQTARRARHRAVSRPGADRIRRRVPASEGGLAGPGTFSRQSAENVAEAGYRGLMQGKRRSCPGFVNKLDHRCWSGSCRAACCWRRWMPGRAGAGPRPAHSRLLAVHFANRRQSG